MAVLTRHHRNYLSPIITTARGIVRSGVLGSIVAVTGTALFHKPDDYFEVGGGWRRQPGGGPILLNLIHEVNNLLALVGDVVERAGGDVERHPRVPRRGHRRDDLHLRRRRAGHLPALGHRGVGAQLGADLAGERRVPHLSRRGLPTTSPGRRARCRSRRCALKVFRGSAVVVRAVRDLRPRRWSAPIRSPSQVDHFAAVIRDGATPICSGRDGLKTLQVVDAVLESARTGRPVQP